MVGRGVISINGFKIKKTDIKLHVLFWSLFFVTKILVEIPAIAYDPLRIMILLEYLIRDISIVYVTCLFIYPYFNKKRNVSKNRIKGLLLFLLFAAVHTAANLFLTGSSADFSSSWIQFYLSNMFTVSGISGLVYMYYYQQHTSYSSIRKAERTSRKELEVLKTNNFLDPIPELIELIGTTISSQQIPALADYLRITFQQKNQISVTEASILTEKITGFFNSRITLSASTETLESLFKQFPLLLARLILLTGVKQAGNISISVAKKFQINIKCENQLNNHLLEKLNEFSSLNNMNLDMLNMDTILISPNSLQRSIDT